MLGDRDHLQLDQAPRAGTRHRRRRANHLDQKKNGLNLQTKFTAKMNLPGVDEFVKMTQSTQTTALRLNVDLPDSLFVFNPPEAPRKPRTGPSPASPARRNRQTPAQFQAPSLDGEPVDLEALRGKVVLLDFWASWCIPAATSSPFSKNSARISRPGLGRARLGHRRKQPTVEKLLEIDAPNLPDRQ